MQLDSCIYECEIWHSRQKPKPHKFVHKHFMLYLDLGEVSALAERLKFFSTRDSCLYSFKEADYLPGYEGPSLEKKIRNFAALHQITGIEKIKVLTNVRTGGYIFNPVTFFFCFDRDGRRIGCIVEVGNTFKEKKLYALKAEGEARLVDRQKKQFYVSPFTELDQDFVFDIEVPGQSFKMTINTLQAEEPVVMAGFWGKREELTDKSLLAMTLRYPLAPLRVIALIHLHALLLWLKRTPYHRKEENAEQQTGVLNPHRSIEKTI
ncbi:DUF1365 family protein [bacterium]|nr:DUF1365 family protein [bacterium]